MSRVLITGIDGFAGRHLAHQQLEAGHDLTGLIRPPRPLPGFEPLESRVDLLTADILDANAVARAVEQARPERVFHLAGWASAGSSMAEPLKAFQVNALGTLTLLEALRAGGFQGRLLVVSSADVYGKGAPADRPCDESTPLVPTSPYSASKAAADLVAQQYHLAWSMDVVRVRPYNHTGSGQALGFVCPDFARQVALIEAGRAEPVLRVGNLEPIRDFSHVLDIIEGYDAVMERGRAGEVYNLGSGRGRPVSDIVDHLCSRARRPIRVQQDPARMRVSDVPYAVADIERVRQVTGWEPRRPLEDALDDLLEEHRRLV